MIEQIKQYRKRFNELQTEQNLLKKQYKQKNSQLYEQNKKLDNLIKAQQIIQDVVQETQNKLKVHITDIVNLAINSIPFSKKPDYFDLEFVVRRNQTECDLFYVENNRRMHPVNSSGGGVLDITSFGLQIACWALQRGKKSNTIILDEPFKNINDPNSLLNLKEYICEMLKKMCNILHLQFIIVGSNNDFIEIGNVVFEISLDENKNSIVKTIIKE